MTTEIMFDDLNEAGKQKVLDNQNAENPEEINAGSFVVAVLEEPEEIE